MADRLSVGRAAGILVLASLTATCGLFAQSRTVSNKSTSERSYAIDEGTMTFRFNTELLEAYGLRLVAQGQLVSDPFDRVVVFELDPTASPTVAFSGDGVGRLAGGPLLTCGAFLLDRPGERVVIGNLSLCPDAAGGRVLRSTLGDAADPMEPFDLGETWVEFDSRRRQWRMESELLLDAEWAERLEIPDAAGVSVGSVTIDAFLAGPRLEIAPQPEGSCDQFTQLGAEQGVTAAVGSDVLVADLQSVIRYVPVGGTSAFAVGTTACNIGNQRANWIQGTNQHPVIIQNLYRLRDDRFEQIGMSWVKHGFYAVSDNFCEPCNDPTNGTMLGVGCSDPYSANLNGIQTNMSPRSTVNPNTGYFPYPWSGPAPVTSIERRIQVPTSDLDPNLNPDARYFIEGHYVHPDDCVAGTQDNNASYREVRVIAASPGYSLAVNSAWPTQRGQAAVRAWRDADPSVSEIDIRVPGEGLFILAAKATPLGDGYWHYAYALQNLNSDRSARSFSLMLPAGAIVENAHFHDVPYHSGEPYTNIPWAVSILPTRIAWFTDTYAADPDANALRFDTIANFSFDTNVEPETAKAEIELFKPGLPESITGNTVGPRVLLVDCNENTIPDLCDVECGGLGCSEPCGTSLDCNRNGVPDECEPDCNANGVADECDITDCPPNDLSCADCNRNLSPDSCDPDCDGDGIPDDCELVLDTDRDGVDDCDDFCPTSTPAESCLPPLSRIVTCCYPNGILVVNLFTWRQCIETGGGPVCDDPPMCPGTPCRTNTCRRGCLIGDSDDDGDLDLRDFSRLQACYGGSIGTPGFVLPPSWCLEWFDLAEDLDIDGEDHQLYVDECSGPR